MDDREHEDDSQITIKILQNIRCSLTLTIRDLNKAKSRLITGEKKLSLHVKKVKNTKHKACIWNMVRILAISQNFSKKISMIKAILQSISLDTSSLIRKISSNPMLRPSGFILNKIKRRIILVERQIIATNFKKVLLAMEMKEEVSNDVVNDILVDVEDDGEIEIILKQILSDMNIKVDAKLSDFPADLDFKSS